MPSNFRWRLAPIRSEMLLASIRGVPPSPRAAIARSGISGSHRRYLAITPDRRPEVSTPNRISRLSQQEALAREPRPKVRGEHYTLQGDRRPVQHGGGAEGNPENPPSSAASPNAGKLVEQSRRRGSSR